MLMTAPHRQKSCHGRKSDKPTKRKSRPTVAQTLGYCLTRQDAVTARLGRLVRLMCYFDALVYEQFMLEYIEPYEGYPYYLLWYHNQFVGIVHIRANERDPREIRRRLPRVQARLAAFLAEIGFEPDLAELIEGGARSTEDDDRERIKHLF